MNKNYIGNYKIETKNLNNYSKLLDNENINKRLLNNSLFYKVAKYNLCERLFKLFKENKEIDIKKLEFQLNGLYKEYIKLIYILDNNYIELYNLQFNTFNKSIMNFKDIHYNSFNLKKEEKNIINSSSNIILKEVKNDDFIAFNNSKIKIKKLSWIDIYIK